MEHEAQKLLEQFRDTANPSGPLHSTDRELWRKFVVLAHADGGAIAEQDVTEFLREKWHVDAKMISELGGQYYEERHLLRYYDEWLGR